MTLPIYLDYAATTPVDPRVAALMQNYLTSTGIFGNPASLHAFGKAAKTAVEEARVYVAELLRATPEEIIWTSGATEADNLALKGAAMLYQGRGKHIITVKTEHQAVLETCQHLEKKGFKVTYLKPDAEGFIDVQKLQEALRPDTILVSIMHVNNEIGVIQNLEALGSITRKHGILFHVDAAQSLGKIEIDVNRMAIDLLSLSAHKNYGPKGIGALYVRKKPRIRVAAEIHGGGQEQGMRSGTLATHQIVGLGEACRISAREMQQDHEHISALRQRFLMELLQFPFVKLNGSLKKTVPGIVNLCFQGFNAKTLMQALPELAISTGSACHAKGIEASYVLRSLGLSEADARASLRFSFGRFTTHAEIDSAIEKIRNVFG